MLGLNVSLVIAWICVFAFLATVIITLLALTGKITLGGGDGKNHDIYLRKLFYIVIIEIVGISITVYADYRGDEVLTHNKPPLEVVTAQDLDHKNVNNSLKLEKKINTPKKLDTVQNNVPTD